MKNKAYGVMAFVLVFVFLGPVGFAADTKSVNISAAIPQQNGLTVTVSKVVGTVWTAATGVDFGSLVFDADHNIFTTGGSYYAMDVGINSNAADWTVTHKVTSVTNGADTLDKNINVTFMKQTDSATGTQLDKVSYADSNNKAYTKTQLSGGWLRIYYGLATGDGTDAPGTTPIGNAKNYGNYQGTITITLTP